jgi:signal transduction histidine kinase
MEARCLGCHDGAKEGDLAGVLYVRYSQERLAQSRGRVIVAGLAKALGALLIASVGIYLLVGRLVRRPLEELGGRMQEMADGRADLHSHERDHGDDRTRADGARPSPKGAGVPRTREAVGQGASGDHQDVLDLARIEAGRVELDERRFDLLASVANLLEPLRVTAEAKGLRLTHHMGRDVPMSLLGDEGRLRQVLTNLVGNAVKFTERGEVEVTVGASGEATGSGRFGLLFAVRDSGIGISPENLCTFFDTFSAATRSTHVRYGGSGLGLSIAKQLVELMRGRIWAESEPAGGASSSSRWTSPCPRRSACGSSPSPPGQPSPGIGSAFSWPRTTR